MNNLPYTALYVKRALNTDWHVLHLYEHLLIASFEALLEKHSYSRFAYGWVSGKTFYETMFIEAGFYDVQVKKLFDEFMTGASARINYDLLDNELEVVQAEERALFLDFNKEALITELNKLDAEPLVNFEKTTNIEIIPEKKAPAGSLLKLKKNARKFKTFKVIMSLPAGNLEDSAVFLRLTPIIFRIVHLTIGSKGGYMYDSTNEVHHNLTQRSLYEAGIYGMNRAAFSRKQLKDELEKALQKYDPIKDSEALLLYIKAFEAIPTWNTFPIDFYKYMGMLVSRRKITELFTPERVSAVLKSVKIDIYD